MNNSKKNIPLMKTCPTCGKQLANNAETCVNCGFIFQKKVKKNSLLDMLCLLSLIIASFLCFGGIEFMALAYLVTLVWLIIYEAMYSKAHKDQSVDDSSLRKTRNTICIFFILQFGIVIIF